VAVKRYNAAMADATSLHRLVEDYLADCWARGPTADEYGLANRANTHAA
jgi:hypothetical protein